MIHVRLYYFDTRPDTPIGGQMHIFKDIVTNPPQNYRHLCQNRAAGVDTICRVFSCWQH